MSELNYVKSGQSVGASTINGLIDALGGPYIPSEGGFVKTSKGSLFTRDSNLGSRSRSFQSEFLDVMLSDAPKDLDCQYKMIWIQLGRDVDCVKDRLDARHIYFYDKTTDQVKELDESDFNVNGEDLSYDGYVCTRLSSIQSFKVKNGEEEETVGEGTGYLYGVYIKHEDDAASTIYVITNESDGESVAEKLGASADDVKRLDKLAVATKDRNGFNIIKIPLPAKSEIINGDSDIDFSKDSLSGNVQLSSIHRYDLSGDSFYQLYNFEKNDVSSYTDLSSKNPAILVRTSEKNNGRESHILEYVSISSMLSGDLTDTEYTDLKDNKQKSIDRRTDDEGGEFIQLYKFDDKEYVEKYDDVKSSHILIRDFDEDDKILKYIPLSSLSSTGSEISVDSDLKNQTSSLQRISNDDDEWYQLYNFDKTAADLTVATDLNGPGRWYAPAPTGLTDTSALFLIKDTKSKELKYAQLSVSPPAVDNCSIQRFWTPDFPGQPQMLSLNRFWEHPLDGTLTGVLSSNKQVVDFNGTDGTFLMQGYRNGRLGLKYMHLQLSVDLSAVSADVRCDADVTLAQKSIQKKGDYIQLYNFTNPQITTKKTTLDKLSSTYDLLDSNDSVLVRSGSELKYKKLQIETKLPGGGGGGTSGYTGTQTQATTIKWNSDGQYKIELWGKDFQYENGLLKSVGDEKKIATLDTVGYSGS